MAAVLLYRGHHGFELHNCHGLLKTPSSRLGVHVCWRIRAAGHLPSSFFSIFEGDVNWWMLMPLRLYSLVANSTVCTHQTAATSARCSHIELGAKYLVNNRAGTQQSVKRARMRRCKPFQLDEFADQPPPPCRSRAAGQAPG